MPVAPPARPSRWSAFGAGVAILVLALLTAVATWYGMRGGVVHRLVLRAGVVSAVSAIRLPSASGGPAAAG